MVMLDSRASRMSPEQALLTLHADYIGGDNANYRKWYFAAQLDMDETRRDRRGTLRQVDPPKFVRAVSTATLDVDETSDITKAEVRWKQTMSHTSDFDRIQQLALWLLIWGEASVMRFTPEALCFIFKLAYDYLKGPDASANPLMAPEFAFLNNVITPLYNFIRDEAYEIIDGQFVKRERDHAEVIGYDDVNQLFWYPESIARILLKDGHTRLYSLPQHQRYLALRNVDWNNAFHKTFLEKRSWMHLFINFTRIWIIHFVAFWYYTSANSTFIYQNSDATIAAKETPVMYSAIAVGSGIAVLFVIFGCIFEYSYVRMTWRNAKVLTRRLIILAILFIINVGPSVYCIGIDRTSHISWIVSVVQLCISIVTTLYLSIVPMSRLFILPFGTSRKTLASQTFTANYPHLEFKDRLISIALWSCVFGCKLIESYFFLALSFKDSFNVMSKMRISNCNDAIVGSALCTNMPIITLVLMMCMYLILFFLDTYLWYIIWNTVFSIIQSFLLGFSIWTPWQNIFSRLPKRIYTKLVATSENALMLKPKVLCSQIWNAIVISMYREHFLSAENVQNLLYQLV
jgi:1,3-beta-glucan synthase